MNRRLPHQCSNIEEVRNEIDSIDHEIIRLLGTRLEYVREIVKYKDHTVTGIEACDRRAEVLKSRREWASENGLNPDVVEDIYNRLVEYFIVEEKKIIKQ